MKKINFFYFLVYNLFYKNGWGLQDKQDYWPIEQRPILLFCFSSWLWTVILRLLMILLLGVHYPFSLFFHYEALIPFFFYILYATYFILGHRYWSIYSEYQTTNKEVEKESRKKLFIILLLPLPLIPFCVLIAVYILQIKINL
jgi:hypothetical protein